MCVKGTSRQRPIHTHTHTLVARHVPAVSLLRCGSGRRSSRGSIDVGQREVVRALLEADDADDAVDDVLSVRVHGRRDDPRKVVPEEVGRVEARVARSIPPALPIFGAAGKVAEAPDGAALSRTLASARALTPTLQLTYTYTSL